MQSHLRAVNRLITRNWQRATRATATGTNGKCQKQTSESGDPKLDLPYPPVYVNEMSVENEKFLFIINRMQFLWPIVRRVARLADFQGDEAGVRRTWNFVIIHNE